MSNPKQKQNKNYKVIVVEWGDAFIDTEDFDLEDAKKTIPVYRKTVGYLIAKNQHGFVMATDVYDLLDDGVAGKLFIPKGMVTDWYELKRV